MKTSNKLWFTIAVGIVLVGCNSFNRYELKEDPRYTPFPFPLPEEYALRNAKPLPTATDSPVCPPYQMPQLPPRPELPFKKLAEIRPGDNQAVDDLYTAHIRELRVYIGAVNSMMQSSYSKYMEECGKYVSKKSLEKQ